MEWLRIEFLGGCEVDLQRFQGAQRMKLHCTCTNTLFPVSSFVLRGEQTFTTCIHLLFVLNDCWSRWDKALKYEV